MNTDKLEEINIDFTDDNNVTHFDGYCIGSEDGQVLAYGINGEVYYCNPEYKYLPSMEEAVREYKENFYTF